MASKSDQDWQLTKKTVLERNCYMFNNSLMSDIEFICGEQDGKSMQKKFYCHKYVLATSSPVFYAMFYGDLAEKNSVIHLPDANEESFEEFLRFLYTDECKLTIKIAVIVKYLAMKYSIPFLKEKCDKVIQAKTKPDNAVMVLEQAMLLNQENLSKRCWEMVDMNTNEAVSSAAFTDTRQTTLIKILQRDRLNINENKLFQTVLKWSDQQCLEKELEITGENRRAVLGEAIYQIRFLSMSEKEFTHNISSSADFLTDKEKLSIYGMFNGVENPDFRWNLIKRRPYLQRCSRFHSDIDVKTEPLSKSLSTSHKLYGLGVSFSEQVSIRGVSFFGDRNCTSYDVVLQIGRESVSDRFHPTKKSSGIVGFDVMLKQPVSVDAKKRIEIRANIKGPKSLRGRNERRSTEAVIFHMNASDASGRIVKPGPFHEIIFTIPNLNIIS